MNTIKLPLTEEHYLGFAKNVNIKANGAKSFHEWETQRIVVEMPAHPIELFTFVLKIQRSHRYSQPDSMELNVCPLLSSLDGQETGWHWLTVDSVNQARIFAVRVASAVNAFVVESGIDKAIYQLKADRVVDIAQLAKDLKAKKEREDKAVADKIASDAQEKARKEAEDQADEQAYQNWLKTRPEAVDLSKALQGVANDESIDISECEVYRFRDNTCAVYIKGLREAYYPSDSSLVDFQNLTDEQVSRMTIKFVELNQHNLKLTKRFWRDHVKEAE